MSQPITTRNHPSYWAFIVHRASGVGLACFLPVHLYVIGLAIKDDGQLDSFLSWAETLPVKLAETGLVLLLAAHMAGGVRAFAVRVSSGGGDAKEPPSPWPGGAAGGWRPVFF